MQVQHTEHTDIILEAHDIGNLVADGEIEKDGVTIRIGATEKAHVIHNIERSFKQRAEDDGEFAEDVSVEPADEA